MYNDSNQYHKIKTLIFVIIFTTDKLFSLGDSKEEKCHNLLHKKKCAALCENFKSLNSRIYLIYLRKICNSAEQKSEKFSLLVNKSNINKVQNICRKFESFRKNKDLKINFTDYFKKNKSMKLAEKNARSAVSSTSYRNSINLMHEINRAPRIYQKVGDFSMEIKEQTKTSGLSLVNCSEEKLPLGFNTTSWTFLKTVAVIDEIKKFNIINEESEYIHINLKEDVKVGKVFLWYAGYTNTKRPKFQCRKVLRQNFTLYLSPSVNYLICLATVEKYLQVNIFDCQPYKTKPLRENQPLLVKKSIPTLIVSVFVLFILAMALGATVLYLLIHKNPSLIRGNKRVIEVKRQDKTQILIMPKSYENLAQTDGPLELSLSNVALEPAISTLSFDTNSTISYVSANQPTPVEILTYRLNRLRELFQGRNNNIPSMVSLIPMSSSLSLNQRLPPNVDLLLEYEWYTITTTIITTTTTTEEK